MANPLRSNWYLVSVAVAVATLNVLLLEYSRQHPDHIIDVLFLVIAGALLSLPQVRIEQGRLTLSGIAVTAAALLLNPLNATLVGIATSLLGLRHRTFPIAGNAIVSGTIGFSGSVIAAALRGNGSLSTVGRLVVVLVCIGVNVSVVAIAFRIRGGGPLGAILSNLSAPLFAALVYLGLAALLISYLVDGTWRGYFLAAIVCVLALALTDSIAGRRIRQVLESELSDADRHLFHSRAVEGVVHNLRNHIASAVGYLKEIDLSRLDKVDREAIETASAAANDAAAVLRTLSQGATPRVSYAPAPVDLNELAVRALGMARPRAKTKEVELGLRESPEEVKVKADPLLLREVITNLVNNAIDAAPKNGHVELTTGRRSNGWPFVSVSDNGPGVSDENRHHLFEPHFTTKEGGTGLGLFMSYGIVREHQGDILFNHNRPSGAIFTMALPPYSD